MEWEFAIHKKVLNNGTEILTPLVRRKSRLFKNKWNRIVHKYSRYLLEDIDWDEPLTQQQCEDHIAGYKLLLLHRNPTAIKEDKIVPQEVFKL